MQYSLILGFMCSMTLAACGGGTITLSGSSELAPGLSGMSESRPTEQIKAEMESTWAAIQAEVGTPVASELSQCGSLPVGAKACGGPSGYIIYSRSVSNEARLQTLTQDYTRLAREWNAANRLTSDCMLQLPPTVELVAGVCVAK